MSATDDVPVFDEYDYRHGPCDVCECPLTEEGDCAFCAPRVALEDTPVRASFAIDDAGNVTWSGWCA